MAKVRPGDLFEVNWPFTDQDGAKRRPAVALGAEDSHCDVELLMVTTQKQHGDCVALAVGDYATVPLPKPSFVRIARPLKVRMDRITPLGLQLTSEKTAHWYRQGANAKTNVADLTRAQICQYVADAHAQTISWIR